MSLKDVFASLKDFDPKKDKVGGNSALPAGKYYVSLSGVTHQAKNDREFVMFTFEVLDGEFAGRKENVFPSLELVTSTGKPMPDFVLERSIKTIMKIASVIGFEFDKRIFAGLEDDVTNVYEEIQQAFSSHLGKTLTLEIIESRNKKDPDHPYRNYDFYEAEQPTTPEAIEDPFADNPGNEEEIDESKMPF